MSAVAQVVIGVDGGATKTACKALLASTQEALAQAYAGPSNWCTPLSCIPMLTCVIGLMVDHMQVQCRQGGFSAESERCYFRCA